MSENIYSVSEINNFIKNILDNEYTLRNVQITGEISNFKRYPSGHCYFTLKDSSSVLKAVMFKSNAVNLRFEPQNGDHVLAVGRINVYERDGVYQLYTDMLIQQGAGNLMLAYEQLKNKLEKEGLFAEERKQALPVNPKVVGIITSSAGAAVRDIITVSRRRNQGIKLLLYPVKVQGQGSAKEIAEAVKFFNQHKLAEVLIVGRGGGSIEELWSFNEEITVRAVAASKIPVISAVGHETDFTLCDFAADKRAATPSQAAELAVADLESIRRQITANKHKLLSLMQQMLQNYEHRVQSLSNSRVFKAPENLYSEQALRTDAAYKELILLMEQKIKSAEHGFAIETARLDALSPLAVLKRGYSITKTSNDKVLTSVEDIQWGEEIVTDVIDGRIVSVVQSMERR